MDRLCCSAASNDYRGSPLFGEVSPAPRLETPLGTVSYLELEVFALIVIKAAPSLPVWDSEAPISTQLTGF